MHSYSGLSLQTVSGGTFGTSLRTINLQDGHAPLKTKQFSVRECTVHVMTKPCDVCPSPVQWRGCIIARHHNKHFSSRSPAFFSSYPSASWAGNICLWQLSSITAMWIRTRKLVASRAQPDGSAHIRHNICSGGSSASQPASVGRSRDLFLTVRRNF